jgi:hypothetical protein
MNEREYPLIELDKPEGEPQFSFSREIIYVNLPHGTRQRLPRVLDNPIHLIIGIDSYGQISIEQGTVWYGKKYQGAMSGDDMKNPALIQYDDRREIYDWLIYWEYAEWRRIGPEDSELFVTKKLADQLRTTTEMHW